MKRDETIRALSWLIPTVCVIFAACLVFWQYRSLQLAKEEVKSLETNVASIKKSIDLWKTGENKEKIPYAQDTRLEESHFLDTVRRHALDNGVKLIRWTNEPPVVQSSEPNAKQDQVPEFMKDVRTLVSTVEVAGTYDGVRGFVKDLLTSERLLSVRSGNWSRGDDANSNKFSFKLNRYVSSTPPVGVPAPSASTTPNQGSNQG